MNYKEERPWGSFENLLDEDGYKVKKIIVNPDQRLSLQLHQMRSEFWYILSGGGFMQVGGEQYEIAAGDTVQIPLLQVHRVICGQDDPLVILELQTGVCDEDDIIRIEDDYNRV
tara:strand:+ start:604 stop:945 length:342 start_codon:yes stop_codon:yes gene_type:complete